MYVNILAPKVRGRNGYKASNGDFKYHSILNVHGQCTSFLCLQNIKSVQKSTCGITNIVLPLKTKKSLMMSHTVDIVRYFDPVISEDHTVIIQYP